MKTVAGSYTASSEPMTYDLDGNLLTWDGWTFTWNGENRLIKAEKGLLRVEADYDYTGRRFEKKVYHGETLTSHQRFLYDDYKLVEIRDALNANALETAYVWQPLQLDVPVAMKSGADWAYYLFDGNKNITSLRAEDGTVLAEYHYGPFGQTLSATGDWANVNPFRFSSEYHDEETGLVYYNYRHYSPTLGRWLNRDPIEEDGGVNLYGMVGNDVINLWDNWGLDVNNEIENPLITESLDDNCSPECIEAGLGYLIKHFIIHFLALINNEPIPPRPISPHEWNPYNPAPGAPGIPNTPKAPPSQTPSTPPSNPTPNAPNKPWPDQNSRPNKPIEPKTQPRPKPKMAPPGGGFFLTDFFILVIPECFLQMQIDDLIRSRELMKKGYSDNII